MRTTALALAICGAALPAFADDPLLNDTLEFSGQIFLLDTGVPGVIIGGVRKGETAVFGFGETAKGSGLTPDGDTVVSIGSVSKTFTGLALAHLVAEGTVAMTDPAGPLIDLPVTLPERDGHPIRLVDLATHASGLPRELESLTDGSRFSDDSVVANLADARLLFTPGRGIFYSNMGFDLLGMALSGAAGTPFVDLMQTSVLDPIGLAATSYNLPEGDNVLTGYDWNGNEMPEDEPAENANGASRLHSTAKDMLRYLQWNLDTYGDPGQETRALSHAGWLVRDGLETVYGMDTSGHMDAMGLGWVIMMPDGDRPLILQKSGGAHGIFTYVAFAPGRDVGVFMAINQYNFSASAAMGHLVNDLVATLSPR